MASSPLTASACQARGARPGLGREPSRARVLERRHGGVLAGVVDAEERDSVSLRGREVAPLEDDPLREDGAGCHLRAADGVPDRLQLELEVLARAHTRADAVQLELVGHRLW